MLASAIAGQADVLVTGDQDLLAVSDEAMDLNLTAVFQKVPEGYIGFLEELPGANTQGATLDEARANLREAVTLILEANRQLLQETTHGDALIREPLSAAWRLVPRVAAKKRHDPGHRPRRQTARYSRPAARRGLGA